MKTGENSPLQDPFVCMYVGRRRTVRLGLDTNAVWVDAGQMMTTRTSNTQTQTSSQDTQPAWLPHTLSWRTHNSRPRPPLSPPPAKVPKEQTRAQQHNRRQGRAREAGAVLLVL